MLPLKGNEIKVSVTTDMDIFELDCYVSELKEVAVRVLALCDIKRVIIIFIFNLN